MDIDDEVRDRSTYYLKTLLQKQHETMSKLVANTLPKNVSSLEKALNDYLFKGELICYLLAALFPPYDRLKARDPGAFTEATLRKYADGMIDMTLAGLRAGVE